MAEYIKFRLTAAKIGVSMALMALIAGIAEKVHGAPQVINSRQAAQVNFNKLPGISKSLKTALVSEQKQISQLNNKWSKVYKEYKELGGNLLTLNGNLLNVQKALPGFLTNDAANSQFLKIDTANAEFLTKDGTAARAALLGNLAPSDVFQGHGNVVSGALSLGNTSASQTLVSMPNGIIVVLLGNNPASGQPTLTIRNNSGELLPAVQTTDGTTGSLNLRPNSDTSIPLNPQQNSHQAQLTIFPGSGGGFNEAVSILIGLEPNPNSSGQFSAVGQMLIGLL